MPSSSRPVSGDSDGACETVFLGAGASIAYYLAAGYGQYSPRSSLIIGTPDPWAGKRGPGVVAHPENMITPMLEFLGQKIDSVWTERGRFAHLVATVIQHSGVPRIEDAVVSVEETSQGIYLIKTGSGHTVLARNIIGGMGAGDHRLPTGKLDANLALTAAHVSDTPGKDSAVARRVMSMDVFTQVADRLHGSSGGSGGSTLMLAPEGKSVPGRDARSGIHVVLSGGNGGIDVAFTALQMGFKVTWLVGADGPRFLEGFFNVAAKYAFDRSPKVKETGVTPPQVDTVQGIAETKLRLQQLYAGQEHILFDKVVDHFSSGTAFEAVHFANAGPVSVKGTQVVVQTVLDNKQVGTVAGDLFVYAHGPDLSALRIFGTLLEKMTPIVDENLRFLSSTSRESPAVKNGQTPQQDTVLGLRHQSKGGGSIKLIGAAAFRRPDQNTGAMAPVVTSLPPNVLINDQLTPSRSQIEAQLNYVRPNAASFADFITDDRTQLAVHIAARYPFIPPKDIEKHVAAIIVSRRKGLPGSPEITAVPPYSAAFQQFWETVLTRLDDAAKPKSMIRSKL
jgi:hypothetical protein